MLLGLLAGIQLARGLGPEDYGVYSLAMSIVALLTVPTAFGLPRVLTREVAAADSRDDMARINGAFRWSNRIVATTSVILATLVVGILAVTGQLNQPSSLSVALLWGLLLPPLVALGNLRGATLQGLRRIVVGQIPELLLRPAAFSLLLFVAFSVIQRPPSAPLAMIIQVAAAGVSFAVGSVLLIRSVPSGMLSGPSIEEPKRWLTSALPMALTEGMRIAQSHSVILIIGTLSSAAAVGLFRVADATAGLCALPLTLLTVVTAPTFARLFALEDIDRIRRLAWMSAMAMIAGVALLSVPLVIVGDELIAALFGHEFRPSIAPALILCAGQAVSGGLGPNSTVLNMSGNERRVSRAFGFALLVNLAFAIALVPLWGSIGGAMATAAGGIVWNVILWRDAKLLCRVDTSVLALLALRQRVRRE